MECEPPARALSRPGMDDVFYDNKVFCFFIYIVQFYKKYIDPKMSLNLSN